MTSLFEPVLADLSERHRDEILAAFAAVENSPEPGPGGRGGGAARRDAPPQRRGDAEPHRPDAGPGRPARWTSGYRDDITARLTAGENSLPVTDRAVLTLVLVHSVAIPRTEGTLTGDSWVDGTPAPVDELQRRTQLPRGELRQSLSRLRAAGLVRVVPARPRPASAGLLGSGLPGTAYLPGPQFHRLTETARRRLQEELILAAGPDTPLAAAIRRRRAHEKEHT